MTKRKKRSGHARLAMIYYIIPQFQRTDLVLWLLASLVVPGLALQLSNVPHSKPMITLSRENGIKSDETCNICISFADEAIQVLLQLIVGKRAWLHAWLLSILITATYLNLSCHRLQVVL